MKKVAYLDGSKYRRLYNDIVRKSLDRAGIKFETPSTKFGYNLLVSEDDFDKASRIILAIPLYNPSYAKIPAYIKL